MPTGQKGATCRRCKRTFPSRMHLSKRYLCDECGEGRAQAQNAQLKAKAGPFWDEYVARLRDLIGA